MTEGRIIKALSGFYDVKNEEGTFRCRGRGVFRKKISPRLSVILLNLTKAHREKATFFRLSRGKTHLSVRQQQILIRQLL